MHILFICPTRARFDLATPASEGLGGIESTNLELCRALARRGYAVTLLTRTERVVEADGVVNRPLEELRGIRADVAVSSNEPRLLDGLAGSPRTVLWMHNPLPVEKAMRRGYLLPILRIRPDAVFVGEVAERAASRVYRFRSHLVIPHGLGESFCSAPVADGGSRDFVFASQQQRGLDRTLHAWKASGVHGALGGTLRVFGTARESLRPAAARALGPGVTFHPRQTAEALAQAYRGCRAMLYPGAIDETFCLAAAEAQAMGLPVVTLGIGALSERVRHGIDGLIARDDREFARFAALLARDDDLWRHLHEGALLQRSALTWERAALLWDSLLLGNRDAPASR
ncbi:glycosyltransferase family 4 protein [Methylobacterium sp. C25]|uniref:glycosyltransferase family 4 protein n=1 Tax=Methylobacterium sp. C25 TaxID=2721622 RepID=UPI001F2F8DDF|nr:glycosyltransferase family 4 protein [Methylobacterium sp. C25]MCE4225141.1 glycosyltransferase family 4 protein [Methylobacterium sp. C25]